MNSTFTNATLLENSEKQFVLLTLVKFTLTMHFCLGFSLNCCIILLLLSKAGGGYVSGVFALNNAVAEILFSILSLLYFVFNENRPSFLDTLLDFIFGTSMSARLLFQCCVCVERYLAVVHPVTFLRFKPLRYRIACSVSAWICALILGTSACSLLSAYTVLVIVNIPILVVEFFCCVSILKKLRHPGQRDTEREMNAVKKNAFQIVSINLLTCLTQNIPVALSYSLEHTLSYYDFNMGALICTNISTFVGFVQPVFVLHKTGKLPFIRCSGMELDKVPL